MRYERCFGGFAGHNIRPAAGVHRGISRKRTRRGVMNRTAEATVRAIFVVLLVAILASCAESPRVPVSSEGKSSEASPTVDDLLRKQNREAEQRTDRIVELTKPLAECVKAHAHAYELYSSSETADVAARAAVGLCSKEEAAYRVALFQLAIILTSFDAESQAEQFHAKLLETALTIIVGERQRLRAPPSTPPPPSSSAI
jgi:hypothetical protein